MWRYGAFRNKWGFWRVCEVYDGYGRTGAIQATGETPEELINELRMMIRDLEAHDDTNEDWHEDC